MLRLYKAVFFFVISILLSGCVFTQPTMEEEKNANYGTSVTQDRAEKLARKWFKYNLKDSESGRYDFGAVYKGWLDVVLTRHFGYILPVDVNSKNSYGAYEGYQDYVFVFKDGYINLVTAPPSVKYGLRRVY